MSHEHNILENETRRIKASRTSLSYPVKQITLFKGDDSQMTVTSRGKQSNAMLNSLMTTYRDCIAGDEGKPEKFKLAAQKGKQFTISGDIHSALKYLKNNSYISNTTLKKCEIFLGKATMHEDAELTSDAAHVQI